jgi:hypothetical protein
MEEGILLDFAQSHACSVNHGSPSRSSGPFGAG